MTPRQSEAEELERKREGRGTTGSITEGRDCCYQASGSKLRCLYDGDVRTERVGFGLR